MLLTGWNKQSSTAIDDAAQRIQFRLCKLAGLVAANRFQIGADLQNFAFWKQEPMRAMTLGIKAKSAGMMLKRLAPNRQSEAVTRKPVGEPMSHSGFAHALSNLSSLTSIVETLAGFFINVGRRLHPRMMRSRCREVSQKVSKFFKALPGLLVARDAGAALTGSAPAVQSREEETYEASWMPPHDAQFWGGSCDDVDEGYDK